MSIAKGADCGCDPLMPPEPQVANDPGQDALAWRISPHSHVVARLQADLGDAQMPAEVRAVAGNGTDDPSVALLDAFAVIADTVSFYTERIAQEGFLRTATELESVRLLAATIGYELRPGVAAEVELAFDVEDAPGIPAVVAIAAGTPVQSIPGAEQLPQTFETGANLEARVTWNAVVGVTREPAVPVFGDTDVWLEGTALGVRIGDTVLVVGEERRRFGRTPDHVRGSAIEARNDERWEFRYVTGVEEPGGMLQGWTRLRLERRVGWRRGAPLTAMDDVVVWSFGRRAALFGAHAPDPALIKDSTGTRPPGSDPDWIGIDTPLAADTTDVVEVDGDQVRIVTGSWIVLEGSDMVELYGVEDVAPSGGARFGLSGKITRVRVDWTESLERFGRRSTVVHCEPRPLPGGRRPVTAAVPADDAKRVLHLVATDPPLPVGRTVMVTGFAPGTVPTDPIKRRSTPPPQAEIAIVAACPVITADEGLAVMIVTLDRDLQLTYDPAALTVRGNVVLGTHGESVEQVLGSGDATTTFQRMQTRRAPLTHVREATAAGGAASTLQVRVDGVQWQQVESLDVSGPRDRAFTARGNEDATSTVTAGDGTHGARLPTGSENVQAAYRVGIGSQGAMVAGQLTLLPRRPYGVKAVTNPADAHDWADPEAIGQARTNAPQRTRTLDRAVSVADHEDFAAGFAGVTLARADAVWDGREQVVLVSVLGAGGARVSGGLVSDLTASLTAARELGTRFLVLPGDVLRFGIRVDLAVDPAYPRADVEAAVTQTLVAHYGAPGVPFAAPVTAARVLVTVRAVPGVLACTMPRLAAVISPVGASPTVLGPRSEDVDVLAALPGRWDGDRASALAPAQAAAFVSDGAEIGVMVR